MLYQIQNSNDYRPVARALEYDEAVAFIRQRRKENRHSALEIAPEELTPQSWWEFTSERDGSCVYAWGDDTECDIWDDHLERSFGARVWHCRELGIKEAFELDLEKPSDGLDLSEAIQEIRAQLLRSFEKFLAEVSILTAPSLFPTEATDIERAIEDAYYFGLKLEYAGVIDTVSTVILDALEGCDWEFRDEPKLRVFRKATCSDLSTEATSAAAAAGSLAA